MSQNLIKVMKKFYKAREDKKINWQTDGSGDEFDIQLYGDNIAIGLSIEIDDDTDYYEWIGSDLDEVADKMENFIDYDVDEIIAKNERFRKEEEETRDWFRNQYCDWE